MTLLFSYSIAPAAIVAAVRWRQLHKEYYPIAACLLLALVNEVLSTYLLLNGWRNAVNNNIYTLIEAVLIVLQFRNWGLFDKRGVLLKTILILLVMVWVAENRSVALLESYTPFFRMLAGMMIVVMGIIVINKLVISYEGSLWRCPAFLFCWGFNLYFSIVIVLEIFLYYNDASGNVVGDAVFRASTVINLVANILYLFGILWIPKKPRFIMQ